MHIVGRRARKLEFFLTRGSWSWIGGDWRESAERVRDVRMVVSAKWKPMEKKEIHVVGG
jgi:hypothetical protein